MRIGSGARTSLVNDMTSHAPSRLDYVLQLAVVALVGLNLRPFITGVGPLAADLSAQTGLGLQGMALLTLVQEDVERVVAIAKHHFRRARPFMVDPALPHCGKGEQALKAYPSGHAAFAWSAAWTLAALAPDHAAAVMARAQDYGLSREICGVHYPSDVEASHGMATAAAQALLTDPRLASQVAAARAEWR